MKVNGNFQRGLQADTLGVGGGGVGGGLDTLRVRISGIPIGRSRLDSIRFFFAGPHIYRLLLSMQGTWR